MKAKTWSGWASRFWAVVKYELLWNIRKKKFIGVMVLALALATLNLVLPVILRNIAGVSEYLPKDPDYVISTGVGLGGMGMFLFAVAIAMNSISGEFESGSIVPLLTKPVSRTMIFIGKLLAAFITIFAAYTSLLIYMTVGGWIIYGPQNNLHLLPLSLIGTIISTFVWIAIVIFIGTLSKNSLLAALGTFGIYMALNISSGIISVFTEQAWILNYPKQPSLAAPFTNRHYNQHFCLDRHSHIYWDSLKKFVASRPWNFRHLHGVKHKLGDNLRLHRTSVDSKLSSRKRCSGVYQR
ncbi:MAG: ABC transporter permease [Candidatus Bathyarchaeia archaeon]